MVDEKTADPDLLENMALANEQTAEYVESQSVVATSMPPGMLAMMLRTTANFQRRLAKDIRDGVKRPAIVSTDG